MSRLDAEFIHVDISRIEVGDRFRKEMGDVSGLSDSIKKDGLIQPIAVTRRGESLVLIAGGRRFAAIKAAGYTEIPVRVFGELDELDLRTLELAENFHRKGLEWQEEIELKKQIDELMKAKHGKKTTSPHSTGHSMADTSRLLGESQSSTSMDIQLANACEMIPQLKSCKNKAEAAKMLRSLKDAAVNHKLLQQVEQQKATSSRDVMLKKLLDNFIICDAAVGLDQIPESSVDLVEIDPPYGIDLKDNKRVGTKDMKFRSYNEVHQDEYLDFISGILQRCHRILKSKGWLILWYGMDPWHQAMAELLAELGFKGRPMPAIWVKDGAGQTHTPQRTLGSNFEVFMYYTKDTGTIKKQGRSNVFHFKKVPPQFKTHPTERPIELMMDIYQTFASPTDIICIPFLGSGNGILAAHNVGMQAYGFELSDQYRASFAARIQNMTMPFTSYPRTVKGDEE